VQRRTALSRWVGAIAGAQMLALLATSTRYGYHRDELYFIVAGSHPAFGYPDQPPLVPLLCAGLHAVWHSLFLLRLPSALVAGTTTVVSALLARELGGDRRAQVIAAGCTASSGFALAVGHFVTTTTPDLLSTTLLLWLVIRAIVWRSGVPLLLAGVVVGVGFEAKPQVGIVATVLVMTLLAFGPRWPFRSWWSLGGVAAAVGLAAPYLVWQQVHGWPQVTVAGNIGGSAEGGRVGFIPFQLVMVSPVLVPVWIAGLITPFRNESLRPLRFLTLSYLALGVAYIVGNGKAYYLASLYPALLGVGAVVAARWRMRTREWAIAIGVSAAASAFLALPLLPARSLQGSIPMAINPDLGEQVGWPRFIDTVAHAWRSLPPATRARTAIFTGNYGEAGAIDVLGHADGLPRAYSGHNGFSEWGEPSARDDDALILGFDDPAELAPQFADCRQLARIDNGIGLTNQEQGRPILLCKPTASWASLWPELRHYD
jgi:Dolichyl-phosphate-mannose-protein mannosyltransferase